MPAAATSREPASTSRQAQARAVPAPPSATTTQPRPPHTGQGSSSASLTGMPEIVACARDGKRSADLAQRPAMELHQGVLPAGIGPPLLGLLLDELEEPVHLALHPLHLLAHVEDDLDAREVHSQVARQGEDDLQAAD